MEDMKTDNEMLMDGDIPMLETVNTVIVKGICEGCNTPFKDESFDNPSLDAHGEDGVSLCQTCRGVL